MLATSENEASFIDILFAICMMKMCLLVRMTESPCRLLCLAKMRHLPSGVTAKERLGSTYFQIPAQNKFRPML